MDSSSNSYGWKSADSLQDHDYTLPAIISLLPPNSRNVLDAGCGNGYIARKLCDRGFCVTAIDQSPDGIALAQDRESRVKWYVRSVYDDLSDIEQCGFDVIISSEVIEHLYSPRKFLDNMHSLLRLNGVIIITTPYHGYLKNLALSIFNAWDKHHTVDWEGGHIKFFSEKTISDLLRSAGFANIRFRNSGRFPYLWKSMVVSATKVR
jgi:2-polyprenyl-3-methyl-5-hydroxy-6-metoxy-1,4-benzoquinol methylase